MQANQEPAVLRWHTQYTLVVRIAIAFSILLSTFILSPAHGENSLTDSLYKVLDGALHDTTRAQIYLVLAEIVYVGDMNEAERLTQRALTLTDKNIGHSSGKELHAFKVNRGGALNNMGYFSEARGKLSKALKSYHYSLQLCEELKDKPGIALALNNIGYVYFNQKQYEKALEYYNRSLAMEQEIGNKKAIARVLNNIGLTYKTRSELKKALEHYKESLRIRREIEDEAGIANSLNNLGMIYQTDGQFGQALEYYLKCVKIQEKLGSVTGLANTLNNIGGIYRAIGKFDEAIAYSERSLELSGPDGDPQIIQRATRSLSDLYMRKEEWEKAFNYLRLNSIMKDSLLNEETHAQITEIQQKYESEKNKQMIALQDEEIARRNTMNLILSGVLVLVFLFAIVLYTRFRLIKKQKHTIEDTKLFLPPDQCFFSLLFTNI